jgi:hypothetical protein
MAAVLPQFSNPDDHVRDTADALDFTIGDVDLIGTARVLCQLTASSDNATLCGQTLLRIHHLIISGDLLSNVSTQIQVVLVEILELPDALAVDWSMITGATLLHNADIVTTVNSEWRDLMT